MTDPFVGEIDIVAFGFAPRGYALAAGQLLPINQNQALYALYGTTFGGNGTTTFGLPNLASRQACSNGQGTGLSNRPQGAAFGSATVTLAVNEMPSHSHSLSAYVPADPTTLTTTPASTSAIGHSGFGTFDAFAPAGQGTASFAANAVGGNAGGQPHLNAQPYLGLLYTVALQGIYPTRP